MASDVVAVAAPSNPQSVSLPPDVVRIADAWAVLPPHIREAVLTLVDAGLGTALAAPCQTTSAWPTRSDLEEIAHRIAKACRQIVQGCLREEEWQDADSEFFEVIADGIDELNSLIEAKRCDAQ